MMKTKLNVRTYVLIECIWIIIWKRFKDLILLNIYIYNKNNKFTSKNKMLSVFSP